MDELAGSVAILPKDLDINVTALHLNSEVFKAVSPLAFSILPARLALMCGKSLGKYCANISNSKFSVEDAGED